MYLRHLDPNVGASFTLSFLVVGLAAVALHPALDASPKPATAARESAQAGLADSAPAPTSAGDDRRPAASAPGGPAQGTTAMRSGPAGTRLSGAPQGLKSNASAGRAARDQAAADRSASMASATARRLPPGNRPAGAFTDVVEGETLADVARRVYGSADAAQALWLANRDRVDRPDISLHSGVLLRTP
jgi:hypothetical protein